MPTYEYECTKCGHVFEVFQSITAKPLRKLDDDCPGCHTRSPVRRLIGAGAGLIFKGSGFYETDYRSESYKAAAKADKSATEAKTDSTKTPSSSETKSDTGKSKSTDTQKPVKKSA
jgi:putative FmdB family regulatory protein